MVVETGGDDAPFVFSMQDPFYGDDDITVSGLWTDGGDAKIGNPYPMRSGTMTVTVRGESHTFQFTSIVYHAWNGPMQFTVIVDGTWTVSYSNPYIE